jgi:hypothetical protein
MTPRATTTRRVSRWLVWSALALSGIANACFPDRAELDGSCRLIPRSDLDCRVAGFSEKPKDAGLVGYACSGQARPDLDSTVSEGVPSGRMCADKGPLSGSDEETYCCTEEDVPCVYNPTEECDPGSDGYACFGNNRPESLNPALLCSNGTSERGLYHYCCTGQPEPSPCKESTAVGCGDRLLGFLCEGERLPRGEDYGPNRSRADAFYPVCSTQKTAPNPAFHSYCCYMALTPPVGGSCVSHGAVPGCAAGRFGFACYGPDTPEDDFPPMVCPEPGFSGRSAEGYDATLYCCDFE